MACWNVLNVRRLEAEWKTLLFPGHIEKENDVKQ